MKRLFAIVLALAITASLFLMTSTAIQNSNAYGDMDGNNDVAASDALVVLQASVKKITLDENQKKYADVDGDKEVTAADALMILQFSVGKIDTLPSFDITTRELIIDLPDSQLSNGAYEYDPTSDNSFCITTEGLAPKTIYVVTNSAISAANTIVSKDTARFFYSLQGLINRDFGATHTSLVYNGTQYDDWLKRMMAEGKFFEGYEVVRLKSLSEIMTTFRAQIEQCGISLWDSNVPATANLAATLCGLEGCLPVQYNTDSKSFYSKLMAFTEKDNGGFNIEVKFDFNGLFEGAKLGSKIADTNISSTGSSKCDAYLWAIEKYLNRCSAKYIAYVVDGAVAVNGNSLATNPDAGSSETICLPNHDYLIARRCFFFDLTCYPGEAPCDDPNQPLGTDADTLDKILQAQYNHARGEIVQMMGFPPWWLKYTTHRGYGSLIATDLEWKSVEVFTAFNCAKEADAAHPCYLANASMTYKYVSTLSEYTNNKTESNEKYDSNTYYFLYYLGDYDSSAWLSQHINNFWKDSARGTMPMMWGFNPNLSDRVPNVWEYIYENLTDSDYIVAGEGAGYVIPSALYQGHKIYDFSERTNPDGMDKWIENSKKYYEVNNIDITGFIIDGVNTIDNKIMEAYAEFSPVGSFGNSGPLRLVNYNGTMYARLHNYINHASTELDSSVAAMYNWFFKNDMKGYNFAAYRTICASPSQTKALTEAFVDYAANKGKTVKLVDPYTFFRLAKESGQAEVINN